MAGAYGGFKIDVKSKVGSLDTAYLLFDETAGFSALMKTFDRNPQGKLEQRFGFPEVTTWTTRAPMLALASPDSSLGFPNNTVLQPEIFLRNTTAVSIPATLRFNWRTDTNSGSSVSPTMRLAPYETRLVNVAALQKSQVIPAAAHWASVELTSSSRPNDLMATAASYDRTLHYGTQTPFNDQLTFHWEGGEWQVDSTHNSIITAGNGGNVTVKAMVTIYYDSGKKRYDMEQELKPHQQMWVDVGKLIHDRVADKNGSVLPSDLNMGSYELQDLTDRGLGNLFEGKVTVDKTFGHATYGCSSCCGFSDAPYMYYDPIGAALGFGNGQDVWDMDFCTLKDVSVLDYMLSTSWDTGNHAIATASKAVITGVAVGSTTNLAQGTLTIGGINSRQCPRNPVYPNGPATVQVPDHLYVLADTQNTVNCSPNPDSRNRYITYEVVDATDTRMQAPFLLKENVPTNIVSSCNNQIVNVGATCTSNLVYQPGRLGEFTDFLFPGCPASQNDSPCGFQFAKQQWQWCPAVGAPTSIGTIGADNVQNTIINVDGNITGFTVGTTFPK